MNKKIAGFLIISASLIFMGIWEFWGRENFSYREVLTLRENVTASTVISAENLRTVRMDNVPAGALKPGDAESITGLAARQFIAAGSPLFPEYFTEPEFVAGGSTGKEILSVPSEWLLSMPQTVRRGDRVTFYNGKIKVLEATVAYVKDGSNQEVVSEGEDRTTASSAVARIEIVGLTQELVELSRLAGENKRFTVVYS